MSIKDKMQAQCGLINGEPLQDGKIHRFHAYGDRPGHDSGFYLYFPDGAACWFSKHLHSAGFCHGSDPRNGRG
ncbi:conserved protein of unknown function [Pseudomonas marincola]|uniref:Uncharacterized protein n=1 Tax=Pseudomonas marincola TaxID=437900 RepID=A0A653DXR0_9PSED|nr:conserved protein of unknown function [Pseudomonas marincola]